MPVVQAGKQAIYEKRSDLQYVSAVAFNFRLGKVVNKLFDEVSKQRNK